MTAVSEVAVTLSDELLRHLRRRAESMRVPVEWLVAGLVCDTIETLADEGAGSPE
jgi:hypothetical protein